MEETQALEMIQKSPEEFLKVFPSLLTEEKITNGFLSFCVLQLTQQKHRFSFSRAWPGLIKAIGAERGLQTAFNIVSRLEVALGYRKPTMAIYDHALHFIGGAQKYGCTLAQALQDKFDVTLISNKEVTLPYLQKWYRLDLSQCRLQVVPIPFFESRKREMELIDPSEVNLKGDNPFHIISRLSGDYDFFINNSMLEMVYPLANVSVFVCHFPEREKSRFFHAEKYTEIVYNSRYTAKWIKIKWGLNPHFHLYPPVEMTSPEGLDKKELAILSVARFDPGGNKQQMQMIKAFKSLCKNNKEGMEGWKLILAGGSVPGNPYLERVCEFLSRDPDERIQLKVNVPEEELRAIYRQAKIFWHFCGLNQKDPAKVEHFGMNIVEAMQNACLPIVFRGGGQPEIVEDGVSGFLFKNEEDLNAKTLDLILHPERFVEMGIKAQERSRIFHADVFIEKARLHFQKLLRQYRLGDEQPAIKLKSS